MSIFNKTIFINDKDIEKHIKNESKDIGNTIVYESIKTFKDNVCDDLDFLRTSKNIECISSYYNKIADLHKKVPDLRIGQLFNNFRTYLFREYDRDIFYIGNDEFIRILEEYIKEMDYL